MKIPSYRVRVDYETEPDLHTPEGNPLPGTEAEYLRYPYLKGDQPMPYQEYCAYYGNPDRHTVLQMAVQEQCAHCGGWHIKASLGNIDMMDDDRELLTVRMEQWERSHVALGWGGYLGETARELLKEAGWSAEYFQRGPQGS